jgi:vancomycin resistance protein YoaR
MKRLIPLLVVLAVTVVGGSLIARSAATTATTPQGTLIGGLPAAGLNRHALVALLRRAARAADTITAAMGGQVQEVPAAEIGLSIDVEATASAALRVPFPQRFWGSRSTRNVAPVLTREPAALGRTISLLRARGTVPATAGDLQCINGTVRPVAPASGRMVDSAAIEAALTGHLRRLPVADRVQIPVVIRPALATHEEVPHLTQQALRILARPITVRAGDREVLLPASSLGQQLTVARTSDVLSLDLRPTAVRSLVSVARRLSVPVREPRLNVPRPTAQLSEKGNARWRPVPVETHLTSAGHTGQPVSSRQVADAIRAWLRRGATGGGVTVVPAIGQPQMSDADAQSVNSLLGTFTTYFPCCPPRVTNIRVIARKIDGIVVPRGQAFSLNGIVGRRTLAKGYVSAPFILGGKLSVDVGGGVSQFATTLFNAAYFAGLRLDRHQAHSFYISRYPPGREATVNYPSIDLVWTNDSAGPVVVRTRVDGAAVTVAIYGHNDGRQVQSVSDAPLPVARRAFKIVVHRQVFTPGLPQQRLTMTTTYDRPPAGE